MISNLQDELLAEFGPLKESMQIGSTETLSANENQLAKATMRCETNTQGATPMPRPSSCQRRSASSGIEASKGFYEVQPNNELDVPHLCDSATDGGGWIVIQSRTKGGVDFYRNWQDCTEGFGSLDRDFWLGNKRIHELISSGRYELRVALGYQGDSRYALYSSFYVGHEGSNYRLSVSDYSGNVRDSLTYHSWQTISTYDRDNDNHAENRAEMFHGGWWYYNSY